jgi:hypothetical protein
MFEEIVGNDTNCYAAGIGQVVRSTDVASAGSYSLKVWANKVGDTYNNHVIGQKLLYGRGQNGVWKYSVQAYIPIATINTGQTGPEISMQNTRNHLTATAGIQYQSNPYIRDDAGVSVDAWAVWAQTAPGQAAWLPFASQPVQASHWYTLTLIADYNANAYISFEIGGAGIDRVFDLSM